MNFVNLYLDSCQEYNKTDINCDDIEIINYKSG